MSRYPVEALLRPTVEFYAAITWVVLAFLAIMGQWVFYFTPSVAVCTAVLFLVRAYLRFAEGYPVHRYKQGLKHQKVIILPSSKLPVSANVYFLGWGFAWDQRHAQRVYDTELRINKRFLEPSSVIKGVRRLEIQLENTSLAHLARLTATQAWWNPLAPEPQSEGNPALHAVGLLEGETKIFAQLSARVGHTRVLGTTRVGKTRLAEILLTADIRRPLVSGVPNVVICFDPKGDPDLFKRMYVEAKAAGRLDKLYFFHLGYPDQSARYNPVGNYLRVTEVAARIAGQMPGEGQSQAFREFVWRYVNVISKTCTALGKRIHFTTIKFYGEDIEPLVIEYLEFLLKKRADAKQLTQQWSKVVAGYQENFKYGEPGYRRTQNQLGRGDRALALVKYCKENDVVDDVAHSLLMTFGYDKKHFDHLVASLMPLMEKLCTGKCAELISPDYSDMKDPRPIFTWSDVIAQGGIVYVGLDALSDPEVASAVGNSMFADLTALIGRIYKKGVHAGLPNIGIQNPVINLHADEFNELIGDEFIPLLNKAGGAGANSGSGGGGVQVTAYTQTWSDVIARLGSEAKAGQAAGNFNTTIMMRVLEEATARMLTDNLKMVPIDHLMTVSAASDTADPDVGIDFTSKTEQRNSSQLAALVHPKDVMSLPKGHAFMMLEGGKLYKVRLPQPDRNDFAGLPDSLLAITQDMERHYRSTRDWFHYVPTWNRSVNHGDDKSPAVNP